MATYIHGNLAVDQQQVGRVVQEVERRKIVKVSYIPPAEKLMYLFAILIFVIVSGILVSRVTESFENNYKIQQIQNQIETIKQQNKSIQLKISELNAPERIISIAENELGMVQNNNPVHLNSVSKPKDTASR